MAKGDDALARKRNKVRRKRLRSSENAVSARVAAIIASKRRRKSGKRRGCEGMCFSLPTPDDPFNDRHGKKRKVEESDDDAPAAAGEDNNSKQKKKAALNAKKQPAAKAGDKGVPKASSKAIRELQTTEREDSREGYDRPSKFLVVCLNAIQDAVDGGGSIHGAADWGVELWRSCSAAAPRDVLDTSGSCATLEQTAWLFSSACDIIAMKERESRNGAVVFCPYLLYLVPSKERAAQVRSICKPLKSLGFLSVSVHPEASIEHQVSGFKVCGPEFLISTPERLLELLSLKAIDISNVSMLVVDGLKSFLDLNLGDKLYSIRKAISSNPQVTIFSDPCDKNVATIARHLVQGRITRLCINDSVPSQSAFIAQYVHFCPSDKLKQKTSKVKEILEQILKDHAKKTSKVLVVAADEKNARDLSSSLKQENCTVTDGSHGHSFTICSSLGLMNVLVKDWVSMETTDVDEFETVLVVDLPPSVDEYAEILTGAARHTVSGEVHSIFCNTDTPLAKPLAELLANCGQVVPEFLKKLTS